MLAKIGVANLEAIGALHGSMRPIRLTRGLNDVTIAEKWLNADQEERDRIESRERQRVSRSAMEDNARLRGATDAAGGGKRPVRDQRTWLPKVRQETTCERCGALFACTRPSRKRKY